MYDNSPPLKKGHEAGLFEKTYSSIYKIITLCDILAVICTTFTLINLADTFRSYHVTRRIKAVLDLFVFEHICDITGIYFKKTLTFLDK